MKLSRFLGVLLVVGGVLVVPVGTVLADCASTPSLETALSETTVAFVGEVTEAQFGTYEAVLRVQWIWKGGDLPEEVVVRAPEDSGVSFRSGVNYIVIPKNAKAPFELAECSGTRIYRGSGDVIPEELQTAVGSVSGVARPQGNSTESSDGNGRSWVLIGALGGMVVLGSIAVYWFKARSRELTLSKTGKASGRRRGSWRRIGGPLSWSARSGPRQLKRMRRLRSGINSNDQE